MISISSPNRSKMLRRFFFIVGGEKVVLLGELLLDEPEPLDLLVRLELLVDAVDLHWIRSRTRSSRQIPVGSSGISIPRVSAAAAASRSSGRSARRRTSGRRRARRTVRRTRWRQTGLRSDRARRSSRSRARAAALARSRNAMYPSGRSWTMSPVRNQGSSGSPPPRSSGGSPATTASSGSRSGSVNASAVASGRFQ